MTSLPDHNHPDLEHAIGRMAAHLEQVTAVLNRLAEAMADGFEQMNRRFDRIEQRLDDIEAHLQRISPNGKQP